MFIESVPDSFSALDALYVMNDEGNLEALDLDERIKKAAPAQAAPTTSIVENVFTAGVGGSSLFSEGEDAPAGAMFVRNESGAFFPLKWFMPTEWAENIKTSLGFFIVSKGCTPHGVEALLALSRTQGSTCVKTLGGFVSALPASAAVFSPSFTSSDTAEVSHSLEVTPVSGVSIFRLFADSRPSKIEYVERLLIGASSTTVNIARNASEI